MVTPIKTVATPTMPVVSSELLLTHERPERLSNGSPQQLLAHATAYGAYCQKLETQIIAWQTWYQQSLLHTRNNDD